MGPSAIEVIEAYAHHRGLDERMTFEAMCAVFDDLIRGGKLTIEELATAMAVKTQVPSP
jgi:hypothetical protein